MRINTIFVIVVFLATIPVFVLSVDNGVYSEFRGSFVSNSVTVDVLWSRHFDMVFSLVVTPAVGDLDGDSLPEIVVIGGENSSVYALNGEDGSVLWFHNFSKEIFGGAPAIGDLNGDGLKDVVVFGLAVNALNGSNGAVLWVNRDITNFGESTPTIVDINSDGDPEIILGGNSGLDRLHMLCARNGSVLWRYYLGVSYDNSVAVGDVDNDGDFDIVALKNTGYLFALEGQNNTLLWGRKIDAMTSHVAPVLGDIDGDGNLEVVFGTSINDTLFAFNAEDGSPLWNVSMPDDVYTTAVLIDVNNDGALDVLVGDYSGNVWLINGKNGSVIWRSLLVNDSVVGKIATYSLVVGDVDGDRKWEVVVPTEDGRIWALNIEDGSTSWTFSLGHRVLLAPVLADLNGDDDLEIVIADYSGWLWALDPKPSGSSVGWCCFQGDFSYRGVVPSSTSYNGSGDSSSDNSGIPNEATEASADESRATLWLTLVIATIGLIGLATMGIYVFMRSRLVKKHSPAQAIHYSF